MRERKKKGDRKVWERERERKRDLLRNKFKGSLRRWATVQKKNHSFSAYINLRRFRYTQYSKILNMPSIDSTDIYYPVSWIKTTTDLVMNLFNSPQKTKRSLPEEAECGSLDGIKCWLREGKSPKMNKRWRNLHFDFFFRSRYRCGWCLRLYCFNERCYARSSRCCQNINRRWSWYPEKRSIWLHSFTCSSSKRSLRCCSRTCEIRRKC